MSRSKIARRQFLQNASLTTAAGAASLVSGSLPAAPKVKTVAAVVTAYAKGLHADVLLGKILEGWEQKGGKGPALKLVAMYVDQFNQGDLARPMSKKYGVPIFDTIEKAITVGGDHIPVDGVISIGEHGRYPYNEKGQHLYPRRRFFKGITDTFRKYKRVVPVFNDKHLGPEWKDAKWMYDQAVELKIPFMAGSSLPVSFRKPELDLSMNTPVEAAVGVGYSGLDIYGFHTLDCFQAIVERRTLLERGIRSVQCLEGDEAWKAIDGGAVRKDLLDAALAVVPTRKDQPLRDSKQTALFLFEYIDGFNGAVVMLPRYAGGISTAVKVKGKRKIQATRFEERTQPYYPHFAYLLKGIERMIHTGVPSYPVERTVLTTGILDAALTSRFEKHRKVLTPELGISYKPIAYPHAPRPKLLSDPSNPIG